MRGDLQVRRFPFVLLISALVAVAQDTAKDWLDRGAEAMRQERLAEAAEDFQRAVDLDPGNTGNRFRLADAFARQYTHSRDPQFALRACAVYKDILAIQPDAGFARRQIGWMEYQMALAASDAGEKRRLLQESRSWYEKLKAANPRAAEAGYLVALIDSEEILLAGLKPDQTAFVEDERRRLELREAAGKPINDAASNLDYALGIDPHYADALELRSIIERERATIADTPEQYQRLMAAAGDWAQKAEAAKKERALAPKRLRLGGNVAAANLVRKVIPAYPASARHNRVQGTVRFQMLIGKDGRVLNLALVSGHPDLVDAARDAVMQWVYRPTLLNGEPVEVITTVDVNFNLTAHR